MKKLVVTALSLVLVLPFIFASLTSAADTGTVTATVTLQNISVSITNNATFAYGTLAASSTKSTVELSSTITATNNGNIAEKFNISGANTTGCVWTLAGTIGADQYKHEFSTTGTFPGTALTGSYQQLAASVASSGTQNFDLRISVPSSSSCYTEATAVVTVQATTP